MHEVMQLAHKFLQSFCLGNQSNQSLLHKDLDLFLTPGVSALCYTEGDNDGATCETRASSNFHSLIIPYFLSLVPRYSISYLLFISFIKNMLI